MAREASDENSIETGSAEPARKPWVAPRLTVTPIGVTTLAAANTIDDGVMNNLLDS